MTRPSFRRAIGKSVTSHIPASYSSNTHIEETLCNSKVTVPGNFPYYRFAFSGGHGVEGAGGRGRGGGGGL